MLHDLRKWCGAAWLTFRDEATRARREIHRGRNGLRMVVLHDTPAPLLPRLERLLDHAEDRFDVVGPEAAVDLLAGRFTARGRDALLFTFDDGFASNHAAAERLAARGIRGLFFVIPSFIDRTLGEWTAHHRRAGRDAFAIRSGGTRRGLSRTEVREMMAMGHVIGGHNDAHLDLGGVADPEMVRGEIDRALEGVEALTGTPCADFAFAFGRPRNIRPQAVARLDERGVRTYACVRGLNLPGLTPRLLLRDQIEPGEPWLFQRACLAGAIDRRWLSEVDGLRRLGGVLPG